MIEDRGGISSACHDVDDDDFFMLDDFVKDNVDGHGV
jgi:hypothetical protein